jgi:outer membrane protein
MNRVPSAILASFLVLICAASLPAQMSIVVVVDFERAVVESAEGKKASEKFNATAQAKTAELEKKQKDIEELGKKLQAGARTLSDTAKAQIQRDIDRQTRELQRQNEDVQKDLQIMRDELLRPIAERATAILQAMAAEKAYTVVIDVSNPENNVVWVNEKNNITEELIKRIDASAPKEAAKPAAPASSTNKPPAASTTKPTTPATPPKQ